ncbi:uncharacterized protein si:ch73-242m19.1 [Osmerus mordax]|uniref:uncharacterized protein si:ch73-242m19.1 n=1 Tax=Osmerus mordax TaxID=8014 RepID=UPI00350E9F1B
MFKDKVYKVSSTARVSQGLPSCSQAEVMQRELESCLNLEYTSESLPLLLHQTQVLYLVREYEDAVQRAHRLAASREMLLSGRGSPITVVTREDVTVYLSWLVCHLHSLKTIHSFLRVSREFRSLFKNQEEMKTFLVYGGTDATESQWGRMRASMALMKEANWISFIQMKPRRDPWQQKLVTKLKELKSVDELLWMHSKFLQVSDQQCLSDALRDHAALVSNPQPLTPQPSREPYLSQIWTSIYNAAHLFQDSSVKDRGLLRYGLIGGKDQSSTKSRPSAVKKATESYNYMDSMQLLGLEEIQEESSSDPVLTRGAYLSLLYLRHLKIREQQRVCLGLLNYLRSVERTLTFDTAGLRVEGGGLFASAEETGWMNAVRGGDGLPGGLDSLHYCYNTPVDYKVHCSEFMEFPEVENLHDFYCSEERFLHTQDQRGLYVVYDAALRDLEELGDTLLLLGSFYIQRGRREPGGRSEESYVSGADSCSQAETDIDRVAVLLDLWTCEADFLESKVQVLNCYFEAYQHAAGSEQRFALAQVITDIMHRKPHLDLGSEYFVQAYRDEIICLETHRQLIKTILDCQIDEERQYLNRVWREGQRGTVDEYGLPQNYVPKYLVSLGGDSPALMSVFLLEVHPSLCLAADVYQGLTLAHTELCHLHSPRGVADRVALEQRLLQQALQNWESLASPGASYSFQTQKDLFSDVFFEDPALVRGLGSSLLRAAEEKDVLQGKEKQFHAVEILSKLLELVTLRHRLMESVSETEHLAQLYKKLAVELGFDGFHLFIRPVQFEFAVQRDRAEQRPLFLTSLLQDSTSLDRYTPSCLPLGIQELDENQIGRFSFSSEEAVINLMNKSGIENLQVTLACQVTQKNALIGAVKQACLCYWAETFTSSPELEKVGLRDLMLNSFLKRKQVTGGLMKNPVQ